MKRDRRPETLGVLRAPLTTLLVTLWAAAAQGFHDGGAGSCDGCHVMHDGSVIPRTGGEGALLLQESPSDVCLVCHASLSGGVLGSDPLAPPAERGAGNFVFLVEDNINDATDGLANPIPGEAAGHNIIAPTHGLSVDSRYSAAPGGTFPSNQLGCTSCHDPHGTDSFRLLYGEGPVQGGLATFTAPPPVASAAGGVEADDNHTAYKSGMSAWCGNCHGNYHDQDLSSFEHPSDESLEPDVAAQYNAYDGDDNPSGGSFATAYLSAVPFEEPGSSNSTSSTMGPTGTSRVMCLTCHRAHASSAPAAGRWDFNLSLLGEDGVVSGSHAIPSPYDDPGQGSLCSKCHGGGGPTSARGVESMRTAPIRGSRRRAPR